MADLSGPSLGQAFRLMLAARFLLFARRLSARSWFGTILGALLATSLAGALGVGAFWLFSSVTAIADHPVWMAFALGLFSFLLGLFWVIWPVIAAQVDEASEMGRFFRFPIRPLGLYGIQTLMGLAEPSVVFFYPALLGALLGLAHTLQPGPGASLGLGLSFVLMCVTTGRCLLNLALNVLTSRRSGEIMFAIFLVLLTLSALIPPVDASWLFERLGGFGASAEDLSLLANTARALGATPPGLLARGLAAAAAGQTQAAFGAAALMLAYAGVAWLLGMWLLLRFYRGGRGLRLLPRLGRRATVAPPAARGWKLPGASEATAAVFEKEMRTLVSNPKGRMLFAVPFFLLIILKIVGAAPLLRFAWGDAWAALLWTFLGLYVLSVLGGQMFANGFGYEGQAVRWCFWSPAPARSWFLGRNLAQLIFTTVQMSGLGLLLFLTLPEAGLTLIGLPLCAFPFALFVLLAVGNLLSLAHPRRFHFSLARRDRPAPAAFVGVVASLGACALIGLAVLGGLAGHPLALQAVLLLLPILGAAVYRLLLPRAARRLGQVREELIAALTR